MKEKYENEKSGLNDEIQDWKFKKEQHESRANKLSSEIDGYRREVQEAKRECEIKVQEAMDHVSKMEQIFMNKERELRDALNSEKEALIRQHLEFAEKMKAEINSAVQLGDEKALGLQERYDELNELFDQRPSRPEDLELI
mmetsp:Transcript_41187/g.36516  ORF Transcript_41187/g.36516 Transcript_41187/m.36516 type:complete len:141 (+) Transcript_41187:2546-2968(+)